jgi:hypothetical protein
MGFAKGRWYFFHQIIGDYLRLKSFLIRVYSRFSIRVDSRLICSVSSRLHHWPEPTDDLGETSGYLAEGTVFNAVNQLGESVTPLFNNGG